MRALTRRVRALARRQLGGLGETVTLEGLLAGVSDLELRNALKALGAAQASQPVPAPPLPWSAALVRALRWSVAHGPLSPPESG